MHDVARLTLTAADYRAMPDGGPRYQLIDGELHLMSPAPTSRHQRVVGRFYMALATYLEDRDAGEVLVSPIDVYLSDRDVVQPDVVFLSRRRASRVKPHGVVGAPDLVLEVLSPSSRRLDLTRKLALYARAGVREAVYVDLEKDEVTVHHFARGAVARRRTLASGGRYESEALKGFMAGVDGLLGARG